jgi:uncharacterized protein (DUF1697 family)
MNVVICMLRGVNVGGHAKIRMSALRSLFLVQGLHDPRTSVQSGNVVFGTKERKLSRLTHLIVDEIKREFGFRPAVILRTPAEMRAVIARNPFAKRHGIDPAKLHVTFFVAKTTQEACEQVLKMKIEPEELRFSGRELYIIYPNGVGHRSYLSQPYSKS